MKFVTTLLLLLCGLIAAARAQVQPASAEEKLKITAEVHRIFEAKCNDCHGAHMPKPKGKFGYVLDLGRVGKNTEYIVPGDLKNSELYQLVARNEMPGENADVEPLTPDELKSVARWVMMGAPAEAGAPPPVAPPESKAAVPFFTKVFNWLGKFHPASTHFPVALLLAAVLAEGFAWWLRKPEWTLVVRFLVVLGALSGLLTATLGWMLPFATVKDSDREMVYIIHRILGSGTAVWGIVCAVLICMAECKEGSFERKRFRGALMLGGALVMVTGLLGGMLTFGLDHYKF